MERSEQLNELAAALASFKSQCPKIKQESTVSVATKSGGSYKFKYADLATIDSVITIPLSGNGLSVTQLVEEPGVVTTMLLHKSGQFISTTSRMPMTGVTDKQAIGGVITYLRRYALAAILGIVSDEDDDANYASGNTATRIPEPVKKVSPTAKQVAVKAIVTEVKEVLDAPTAVEPIPLTKEIKSAMVKAIKDGKYQDVEERLVKYSLSLGDKTELATLISQAKVKNSGSPAKQTVDA